MIKQLYLLPLKGSLLSLQTDIQRVYTALKANISEEQKLQLLTNFERSRQHRQMSYAFFDQTTALLDEQDNIQLISASGNTPIHSKEAIQTFPLHFALTEDFNFRKSRTGPYYSLENIENPKRALFLSKFIKADITDLIPQLNVKFSNDKEIFMDKILELRPELAAEVLVREVKRIFLDEKFDDNPEEQIVTEIIKQYYNTIGSNYFFERFCARGYEIFSQKCCQFKSHIREFDGISMICPGCLCVENRPSQNGKTVLRDFRNGKIISGKTFFRQGKGFYESENPEGTGDLTVISAYQ